MTPPSQRALDTSQRPDAARDAELARINEAYVEQSSEFLKRAKSPYAVLTPGQYPVLSTLLDKERPMACRAKAAKTVEYLSLRASNREALADAGVVPQLVEALSVSELVGDASRSLQRLVTDSAFVEAIVEAVEEANRRVEAAKMEAEAAKTEAEALRRELEQHRAEKTAFLEAF